MRTLFFCLFTLCTVVIAQAQDSVQDTIIKEPPPDIRPVPIGQTFVKQINELLNLQAQTSAELSEIITVMREQAGLDTTYVFKGFTKEGQALYVGPPKEQAPQK